MKTRSVLLAHSAIFLALNQAYAATPGNPVELPAVKVVDIPSADGSAASGYRTAKVQQGPLGETAVQDTPFSVFTVSGDMIRNTQAANSTDALKYVPTVYNATGASQITPYFTMRGFTASTWTYNMAVDGMRTFDIYIPVDDKERVEVMPGATGVLYGITSPAGMINFVSKRPAAEPVRTVTVGSYGEQAYVQADLGGPVTGTEIRYRVNIAHGDNGDTGPEHQTQERDVLSGGVDWQPSPDTKLSFESAWARREIDYAQAQFQPSTASGIPAAPDNSKNFGAPYTYATDATTRLGAGLEHRFNDMLSLRSRYRFSEIDREYLMNRILFQNKALDYKWQMNSNSRFHNRVNQYSLFLDGDFTLGLFRHAVTAGVTRDDFESSDNGARSSTLAKVYSANLYGDPDYPAWVQPAPAASAAQITTYQTVLLADRISIGEQWNLMLSGTQARIEDEQTSRPVTGASTTSAYTSQKFTPGISLSFKPVPIVTTYVSYVEALQQGLVAGSTYANAGTALPPFVSKQHEAGVKSSLAGMDLAAAWFRIEQANQFVDSKTQILTQDGRAIHKGWEFSVTGKPTATLTLTGGFTVLDARIDKAAANVGNTPRGVAKQMAKLYAEQAIPFVPGLTLTGGATRTGRIPWDEANTLYIDSVTLFDAGLRYRTELSGHDTTWRLNVTNLTGKNYWTGRSNYLYPGSPRTILLSASMAL